MPLRSRLVIQRDSIYFVRSQSGAFIGLESAQFDLLLDIFVVAFASRYAFVLKPDSLLHRLLIILIPHESWH